MKKTITVLTLCASLLALCFFAEAQPQAKITKIGWLGAGPSSIPGSARDLFWREFGKLGYVEGKNVRIEYRYAENKLDRLPALAEELVRLKVELLVTGGINGALAAKNATKTIPIVFNNVSDPIMAGLVDSLARPGGNITGFTIISGVLAGKRLELLKEAFPKLARVAVLWDPRNSGSTQQWRDTQQPARELGLQLHSMEVSNTENFASAFKDAVKARCGALTVTQNPLLTSRRKEVIDLAAKSRLPAIYHMGDFVESGGLMSYGTTRLSLIDAP